MVCEHPKIKNNYPQGRKSKSRMHCKSCGSPISAKERFELKDKKRGRR